MSDRVILAGGSGFLGQALARALAAEGREVVVLTRKPRPDAVFREVAWDGRSAEGWTRELDGAAAVVNFTGRSINCVHTPAHRREILESRLEAVKALGQAYWRLARPPPLWIQASGTGYYGNAGNAVCDEAQPAGTDFLAEVCQRWEETFRGFELHAVRRVVLRFGPVFDAGQGALPPLLRLARRYLGGAAGAGRQFVSWIHRDDLVAGLQLALANPGIDGTYNLCAPAPVTNAELMAELRALTHRPWVPPAPALIVKVVAPLLMGVDPALALHGQRASARRIQEAGLKFRHPVLRKALRDLLSEKTP